MSEDNRRENELAKKELARFIEITDCETMFTIKRNSFQDDSKVREMVDQVFEYSRMSQEQYYKMKDVTEFAAHFHPEVSDLGKYVNLCRAMQYLFILDDHGECDWGEAARKTQESEALWAQFYSCLDLVLDKNAEVKVRPVNWKPYITGLYFAIEEICLQYDHKQRKRLVNTYKDYGLANQEEAHLIQTGQLVENLDQLFKVIISS